MEKQTGSLIEYIKLNKIKGRTRQCTFEKGRLKGISYEIRGLSPREVLEIEEKGREKGGANEIFEILKAGLIDPNFNRVDVLKELASPSFEDVINDSFTISELEDMASEIVAFSRDLEEEKEAEKEEIKN